jgi:hypothetical protein
MLGLVVELFLNLLCRNFEFVHGVYLMRCSE